jgi:hypothetical protein
MVLDLLQSYFIWKKIIQKWFFMVHQLRQERPSPERPSQERLRLEQHSSNTTKPVTTKPGMTNGQESDHA